MVLAEAATTGVLLEKVFLEISQNSQENPCCRPEACNFVKTETLVQMFSCEFCEISKNTFFTEHFRATASVLVWLICKFFLITMHETDTAAEVYLQRFPTYMFELFCKNS